MVTCCESPGEWVVLRDGTHVWVGPLAAGDERAIASWFAALGPEARYARFLAPVTHLDNRLRSALARVDHVDHEAIAARASDGATVGIARYIRVGGSATAEVAVAVADDLSGRGIATILLERVAARARGVGIEQLAATCLTSNKRMIRLFRRIGEITLGPSVAGIVEVSIDLAGWPRGGLGPVATPVVHEAPSDSVAA
jgi:GNAT superfamily N-acetyltransferase